MEAYITYVNGQITPEYAEHIENKVKKILKPYEDDINDGVLKLMEIMNIDKDSAIEAISPRYWELCKDSDLATVKKVITGIAEGR